MESITRNVKDIEAGERHVYEQVLGKQLQENQQVVIRVLTPGVKPDQATRREALERALEIARKGGENAAAQGASDEEIDAAIEEAIRETRRQKHQQAE